MRLSEIDVELADLTGSWLISRTPPFAPSVRSHVTPATTAVIGRLEALGFLARERDPHDRRRVLLIVSQEAKTLGWSFFGPLIARILAAMDGFDETDLDAHERVLRAIARTLPPA
jgi:hypothetical protein